jgi:hypothetical protein
LVYFNVLVVNENNYQYNPEICSLWHLRRRVIHFINPAFGSDTLSVFLTLIAAAVLHCCVRYLASIWRVLSLLAVIAMLTGAVALHAGGTWSAIYTLLSLFILACVAMPWLDFWWRKRRAC